MDQVRYAVLLQGGSRDGEVVGVCLPFGQVNFVSETKRGEVVNEIYAVTGQTASHPDHRWPLPVMRCVRCDVGLLS